MTMQRTMKLYRLPEASGAPGQWLGVGKRERLRARPSVGTQQGFGGAVGMGDYQKSDPTQSFLIPQLSVPVVSAVYSKDFILVWLSQFSCVCTWASYRVSC